MIDAAHVVDVRDVTDGSDCDNDDDDGDDDYDGPFFNDAGAMATGWAMRNLTALQALAAVRLGVTDEQ